MTPQQNEDRAVDSRRPVLLSRVGLLVLGTMAILAGVLLVALGEKGRDPRNEMSRESSREPTYESHEETHQMPETPSEPNGEPAPASEPARADPKSPSQSGELEAALQEVRHALSDAVHYSALPTRMAGLLAVVLADGSHGEAMLLELVADEDQDGNLRAVLALVYGAVAGESEAVPGAIESIDSESPVYRLLLLGSRWRADRSLDERSVAHWANVFSGAIQFASRSGVLPNVGAALVGVVPKIRRRVSPAAEAFASSRFRRPWPDYVLSDWARRVHEPASIDASIRLWVARDVLPTGTVSKPEVAVTARWFLEEPNDVIRRSMLTSTLRTSTGGETEKFASRLAELVNLGGRDAGSALRTWMSLDRERAYRACKDGYERWTTAVRGVAVAELLLRWPARTWADFGDRLLAENAPTVLKTILIGTARDGFKGVRADLLRFGDRHHAFIKDLHEKSSTRKVARAWLEFLGSPRR